MKIIFNILKWFFLAFMILSSIFVIYGFFRIPSDLSDLGRSSLGPNLFTETVFIVLTIGCFFGYYFFKNKTLETETPKSLIVNNNDQEEVNPDELINLDVLNRVTELKQVQAYPEIIKEINTIIEYIRALQQKNFTINPYILETLYNTLNLFIDIVKTPLKDTSRGKELIKDVTNSLKFIEETLSTMYLKILEGQKVETETLITALNNKLVSDGILQPQCNLDDFNL